MFRRNRTSSGAGARRGDSARGFGGGGGSKAAAGRRRSRRAPRGSSSSSSSSGPGPVGTEAAALSAVAFNSRRFDYPPSGFVTKIEYSLLYAMMTEAKTYPEEVVRQEIDGEEWGVYMEVAESGSGSSSSSSSSSPPSLGAGRSAANGAGSSAPTGTAASALGDGAESGAGGAEKSSAGAEEKRVSYAQLSAILALSAEKFPPNPSKADPKDSTKKHSGSEEDDAQSDEKERQSIPQILCKSILRTVVRYAEEHGLDRESELRELLAPVRKHAVQRGNKAALTQILPFYLGYAATLITLNPLPILAGVMMTQHMERTDGSREEERNVSGFGSEVNRRADVERAGLLEEADDL